MNITLEQFVKENDEKLYHAFKRASTPHYFGGDIVYHPITHGFNCGDDGSAEPLIINSIYLRKDGNHELILMNKDDKESRGYSVRLKTAPFSIERISTYNNNIVTSPIKINSEMKLIDNISENNFYLYFNKTNKIVITKTTENNGHNDYVITIDRNSHNISLVEYSYSDKCILSTCDYNNKSVREIKGIIFGNYDFKIKVTDKIIL